MWEYQGTGTVLYGDDIIRWSTVSRTWIIYNGILVPA